MDGTWTKIEKRFLWATGSTPKTTGGSETTGSTVLTVEHLPSHNHYIKGYGGVNYPNYKITTGDGGAELAQNYDGTGTNYHYTNYVGSGKGHTHKFTPPYFEVYMWYRTA